ncbi:MAG: hypothetical protein V2I43_13565 [Parvularcula sp.]|nr:hypothetical protein [Parvularcula sp.]
MKKLFSTTAAAALCLAGTAVAAPIADGETEVNIVFDTDGLTLEARGSAEEEFDDVDFNDDEQPTFQFDVTGGNLEAGLIAEDIFHEGGGLRISDADDAITVENFVFSLDSQEVLADVSINGADQGQLSIFTFEIEGDTTGDPFDAIDDVVFTLSATTTLLQALNDVFDLGIATDQEVLFAAATIDVSQVPVPGAALLFAPAAGALWMRRRKQKLAA